MSRISSVEQARGELSQSSLDIDGFIELVNDLLPRYLPLESANKALVSVRLARYFQTNGLLDEPFKEGRGARYGARHVLQLLAVRRLMASGYSTGSLSDLLRGASDDALQRLIEGEAPRVEALVVPPPPGVAPSEKAKESSEVLDFLAQVRQRSVAAESSVMPVPAPAPAPAPAKTMAPPAALPISVPTQSDAEAGSHWTRTPIGQAIEVHTRDDFQAPRSPHEWDVLIEAFKDAIGEAFSPQQKKRRR